jgi:hypothetical protein
VLRPHKLHSICLYVNQSLHEVIQYLTHFRAIHTYQNKGTTARHVRPRDHVVIYTGRQPPELVDGEDEVILSRTPIKVTLDPKGEALLPTSRLNLSKLHTVEHNISVSMIGKILPRDVDKLRQYCVEVQGLFSSADRASQSLHDVDEGEEEEEEAED